MNEFYEEIENTHVYCVDELKDGNGVRVLREFFQNIVKNFSEESFSFYTQWGIFPFIHSEKQLHSVLAPAIHKYTKNIWFEKPFKDYKKNQRFLDIATTDKNNIYLIELKHSFNSKLQESTKKSFIEWERAIEQIADINRKTINGHFNYKDFKVFKIALMVMPTYMPISNSHKILSQTAKEYTNELFEEYKSYTTQKHRPNFIGAIKLNNPLKYKHEFIDGEQIYPYISFIARIEEI